MANSIRIHLVTSCPSYFRKLIWTALAILLSTGLAVASGTPSAPCVERTPELAVLDASDASDLGVQPRYRRAISALLVASRFKELDCLADEARSTKSRFSSGTWKLEIMYQALTWPLQHPTEKDWKSQISRLKDWASERSGSMTARVALADTYLSYAWDARGEGTSDTVSQNGWKLYEQRVAEARDVLEKATKLKANCPEWYRVMQEVALSQGWSVVQARDLFEKAIAFEPAYYAYYENYVHFLLPQWHGEPGDQEKFANEIADRIGGDEGDIVYARLVSKIVCICDADPDLTMLSWPRAQKGYALLETRYGSSIANLNRLAFLAFKFQDAYLGQKFFARIGDQWNSGTWGSLENFKNGQQWAKDMGPLAAYQHTIDVEVAANQTAPGGPEYQKAVAKKFTGMVEGCLYLDKTENPKFDLFLRVGKEGNIESLQSQGGDPTAGCLFKALSGVNAKQANLFPVPPHPSYWVKMTLKEMQVADIAAK